MGVFAWAGLVHGCGAVRTWGAEFGCGAVEIWYQRGKRRMSRLATGGAYVAVLLPGARLRGREGGMLRRKACGTVGGYR